MAVATMVVAVVAGMPMVVRVLVVVRVLAVVAVSASGLVGVRPVVWVGVLDAVMPMALPAERRIAQGLLRHCPEASVAARPQWKLPRSGNRLLEQG
jgi:hypothetical protein